MILRMTGTGRVKMTGEGFFFSLWEMSEEGRIMIHIFSTGLLGLAFQWVFG